MSLRPSLRFVTLSLPLGAVLFAACSDGAADVQPSAAAGGAGAAGTSAGGAAGTSAAGSGGGPSKAGAGGQAGTGTSAGAAGQAGSNAGAAGLGGAGAGGGNGQVACKTVNDCVGTVPTTQPPGCAIAVCDAATQLCKLVAKDFDGDGHGTTSCTATGPAVISLGDDCNDTDPLVFPGAWDGPAGTVKGVAKPSACGDGVDNDCSGTEDDGKLDDGTSCKCVPGDVRACAQDDGGKPIAFPGGSPKGECRLGSQTCLADGTFGPCTGVVRPIEEICDKKDNDCDGTADEADAINRPTWRWDHDGDGHSDPKFVAVVACDAPTAPPDGCVESATTKCTVGVATWAVGVTPDDCNDTDTSVHPLQKEVCDGLDNNCNGVVDEGATNPIDWFFDADGDGFVTKDSAGRKTVARCGNPGELAENCPAGMTTCPGLWVKQGAAPLTDCDDADAAVHPGAWDGPAWELRPYGIDPPGLKLELFELPAPGAVPNLLNAKPIPIDRTHVVVSFALGKGGLEPKVPLDLAARWSGYVRAPDTGDYTFTTIGDDGVRLFIDGVRVINDWKNHAVTTNTATVSLQKDVSVSLALEWFDSAGDATIVLQWAGPGVPLQNLAVRHDPPGGAALPDLCKSGKDWDCSGTPADAHVRTPGVSALDIHCGQACDPVRSDPAGRLSVACGTAVNAVTCHPGTQYCQPNGTRTACLGEVKPETETCDGVDNDCNGTTDDGFAVGSACTVGEGSCRASGAFVCKNGGAACSVSPGTPSSACTSTPVNGSFDVNCQNGVELCTTGDVRGSYCSSINARDTYCADIARAAGAQNTDPYNNACNAAAGPTPFACESGCGKPIVVFGCTLKASLGGLYCASTVPTNSTSTCR